MDWCGEVIESTAALARSAMLRRPDFGLASGAGTICAGSAEASCIVASELRLALAASAILAGPCGFGASATRAGSLTSATLLAGGAALAAFDATPSAAAAAKRS